MNAWIVVAPDDSVLIRIARSEMGQGSSTGLAMLVAEELECDWKKVRAEFVSTNEQIRRNRVGGSMATGGSQSIRGSQEYLRQAGAAAREMLIAAAAQRWKVPESECDAENGVITHMPSERKLRLVQDAGFEPVAVGPLARAKEFDPGAPVFGRALTAAELRRGLGIKP